MAFRATSIRKSTKPKLLIFISVILYVSSLFAPALNSVIFEKSTLYGWHVLFLETAAIIDFDGTPLSIFLSTLFLTNIFYILCIVFTISLRDKRLKSIRWVLSLLTFLIIALPFFPGLEYQFASGYYLWVLSILLLTVFYWRN